MKLSGAVLALVLAIASAQAQDSTHRTAQAVSGQAIRLSAHLNINRDCSPTAPPQVRVLTPPKNGALSIRTGTAKSERIRNCERVEAPVRLVFYRSNAGYSGEDQVSYEITKANGATETHSITINVAPARAIPARPGGERIDL
jgi:hypothetical protein